MVAEVVATPDAGMPATVMHVMAGVLCRTDGTVLLTQRLPGKHLAGLWEFPGGKLEPGESPLAGLTRELREELGIALEQAEPLVQVPWPYGERTLLLDAWLIRQWQGSPQSLEGQALQWCLPAQIDPLILTPADRPVLQALNTRLLTLSVGDFSRDSSEVVKIANARRRSQQVGDFFTASQPCLKRDRD